MVYVPLNDGLKTMLIVSLAFTVSFLLFGADVHTLIFVTEFARKLYLAKRIEALAEPLPKAVSKVLVYKIGVCTVSFNDQFTVIVSTLFIPKFWIVAFIL